MDGEHRRYAVDAIARMDQALENLNHALQRLTYIGLPPELTVLPPETGRVGEPDILTPTVVVTLKRADIDALQLEGVISTEYSRNPTP